MFCYNRSSDLFHGLPFNITSSAMLFAFIAKIVRLIPRKLMISLGDAHIYKDHYDVVKTQLERLPFKFPKLEIDKELNTLEDLEKLEYKGIRIDGYQSYSELKSCMVV